MNSGSIDVLKLSGDDIYFETILPEAAAKAGAFSHGELKHDPATGGYLGKFNARMVSSGSNPGASCDVVMMIELTLVTPERVEA
jgi:hypothetical protein